MPVATLILTGCHRRSHCLSLFVFVALIAIATQLRLGHSLRTGAPAIACLNLRPFHGLNRAKPASASQFFVTQSSLTYKPNQTVTVEIATHSSERYFRGFIVQAYDPSTGSQIGRFLPNDDARSLEGCSSATHRNNLNKKRVSLTWLPPNSAAIVQLENQLSVANQWLGLRNALSPIQTALPSNSTSALAAATTSTLAGGEETGTAAVAPATTTNNNQKRQLMGATEPAQVPTSGSMSPVPVAGAYSVIAPAQMTLLRAPRKPQSRQVRFRATIVVTYEEFYTGFESSDKSFEKFDYASVGERSATPTTTIAAGVGPSVPASAGAAN